MRKRRTLLNEVVAKEPEGAILGENGGFVMNGAVLEVEHQLGGYAVATGDLNDITVSEGVTFQRAQHQETVDRSLRIANAYGLRRGYGWLKQRGAGQGSCGQCREERCPIHGEDSGKCYLHIAVSAGDAGMRFRPMENRDGWANQIFTGKSAPRKGTRVSAPHELISSENL